MPELSSQYILPVGLGEVDSSIPLQICESAPFNFALLDFAGAQDDCTRRISGVK